MTCKDKEVVACTQCFKEYKPSEGFKIGNDCRVEGCRGTLLVPMGRWKPQSQRDPGDENDYINKESTG